MNPHILFEYGIKGLSAIRSWLLLFIMLGLVLLLSIMTIGLYQSIWKLFIHISDISKLDLVLAALALMNTALASVLVIIIAGSLHHYIPVSHTLLQAPETQQPSSPFFKAGLIIFSISILHWLQVFLDITSYSESQILLLALVQLVLLVSMAAFIFIQRFQQKYSGGIR